MLSIPTPDHYLPLLYVIATQQQHENITFPVEDVDDWLVICLRRWLKLQAALLL
jgi:hypothetical protein